MLQFSSTKIAFIRILLIVSGFLLTDVLLQGAYRISKKAFTWESIEKHEVFRVDFLTPINDERYIVPKKNYRKHTFGTDENGFRLGKNQPSDSAKNIVFLGDSVPFGVGVSSENTIPSIFSELVNTGISQNSASYQHIINAAVPSYSLNQAVYHYIYAIKGKFPASVLILQIYDPAANFYILNQNWDVERNWYTGGAQNNLGFIRKYTQSIEQYSSLFYLYWRFSGAYFLSSKNSGAYDAPDIDRYKKSIETSLDTLLNNSSEIDTIVLLPINRPKSVMELITPEERKPIEIVNDMFRSYAETHQKVIFLDIRDAFVDKDESEIFIDTCCHLSPSGTYIQAKYLFDTIKSKSLVH